MAALDSDTTSPEDREAIQHRRKTRQMLQGVALQPVREEQDQVPFSLLPDPNEEHGGEPTEAA